MSSRSTRLPALALLLALSASPLLAQEPTPAQIGTARELVQANGTLNSIDNILPAIVGEIRRQAVTRPEMAKDLDDVLRSLAPEIELQRQQAINAVARAFAKWMTQAEMRDAIAFFTSPSGVKYVRVQPGLQEEAVNALTLWSQQAGEYVLTRTRAEMSKRGHAMQ